DCLLFNLPYNRIVGYFIVWNEFSYEEGEDMGFLYLLGAIVSEVFGSSMLKLTATTKNKLAIIGIVAGYLTSFYLLSLALLSIPLSIGYAIWGGVGTALTAIVGVMLYRERLSKQTIVGIGVLIIGIVLMQI